MSTTPEDSGDYFPKTAPRPDTLGSLHELLVSVGLPSTQAFLALKAEVESMLGTSTSDQDVVVVAYGIAVHQIRDLEGLLLQLEGVDERGDRTTVFVHPNQLLVRVVCRPKQGPERVVTGFAKVPQ